MSKVQSNSAKSGKSANASNQKTLKPSTPSDSKTPETTKPTVKVNPMPTKKSVIISNKPTTTSTNQPKSKSQTKQSKPVLVQSKVPSQLSNNSNTANSKPKEQNLEPTPNSETTNSNPETQPEAKPKKKPSIDLSQSNVTNCVFNIHSQTKTNDIKLKSSSSGAATDKIAESKQTNGSASKASIAKITQSFTTVRKNLVTSYSWTISSFTAQRANGIIVWSDRFTFKLNDRIRFYLQFHPKGTDQTESKHAAFRLFLHESDQTEISVKATLAIKDSKNVELYSKDTCGQLRQSETCDWAKFVSYRQIQDKKKGFLTDDKLFLCCKVEVFNIPIVVPKN